MKNRLVIFAILFLFISLAYIISPSEKAIPIATLYQVTATGTALIAIYTSRIYGLKSANGRAIILLAAGLVLWAVAELIWYILQSYMGDDSFPTTTDIFFLLAYPAWAIGIYQGLRTANVELIKVKKSLLFTVLAASIVTTVLVGYFGVYQAFDAEETALSNAVAIFYGLGDFVLIVLSMLTVLVASGYKNGKLEKFWKTITAGFFLFLVADILFAIYRTQFSEDLKPYTYINLFWLAGYLMFAYAMIENYIHIKSVQDKIKSIILNRK